MKRKLVALIVALIPSALIGLAHTNDALANGHGQCSGPNYTYAATPQQVLANWNAEGVTSQVALIEQQTNGFSPMDVTFPRWLNQQDLVAQLAQPAVTYNRGCRNGHVFGGLAPKHLGTGTVVHTVRPLKWAKSDIKGSRPSGPGWKRIVIRVRLIGPADCTNPETAWVYIVVWVKVKTPVKKPTPKPHPKPHPKPKPKPTPTPGCGSGDHQRGHPGGPSLRQARHVPRLRDAHVHGWHYAQVRDVFGDGDIHPAGMYRELRRTASVRHGLLTASVYSTQHGGQRRLRSSQEHRGRLPEHPWRSAVHSGRQADRQLGQLRHPAWQPRHG
jgi:hypothetical protein